MLAYFGGEVEIEDRGQGARAVTVCGDAELHGAAISVPGDPSSAAFIIIASPPAPVSVTLNGAAYDVAFTPAPSCVSTVDIPTEDLNPLNAEDLKCIPSAAIQQSGILITGAPLPPSYCSNTRWKVTASASPNALGTGAVTTLEQGVAVRVSKAKALTDCP